MKNDKNTQNTTMHMPIFMCLGISIGMAIGAPMNNIPIGMCIGIGFGTCIGGIIDHLNRKNHKSDDSDDESEQ